MMRTTLVALVFLVTFPWQASSNPVQWSSSSGGNDHWYDLVFPQVELNWFDARDAATATIFGGASGYLATITSAQENAFLKSEFEGQFAVQKFLTTQDQDGDFAFIGLSDHSSETIFQWVTGEIFSYEDFGPFEPSSGNASFGDLTDFGHIRVLEDGRIGNGATWQWNDHYLLPTEFVARLGYFVEFEGVTTVPVPPAILLFGSALLGLGGLGYRRRKSSSTASV